MKGVCMFSSYGMGDEMEKAREERDAIGLRQDTIQYRVALRILEASNTNRPTLQGRRIERGFLRAAKAEGISRPVVASGMPERDKRALELYAEHDSELASVEVELVDSGRAMSDATLRTFITRASNAALADAHMFRKMLGAGAVELEVVHNACAWDTISDICKELAPGKRAAVFVPGYALSGYLDTDIREQFLRAGRVQAVVDLPAQDARLMIGAERQSIVVLGSESEEVRFVDATDLSYDDMADVVVETVAGRFAEDSERSCTVGVDEILAHSSILKASAWKDGRCTREFRPLSELTTTITRGTTLSASELEACGPIRGRNMPAETVARLDTMRYDLKGLQCGYLSVSDLAASSQGFKVMELGGMVDLTGVDERQARYFVQDGDLVLNKMRPFQLVMARVREDSNVLASGNLFMIRLDRELALPQYVLSYLLGVDGASQLERAAQGVASGSITRKSLDAIMVPVVPLDEQQAVADEYEKLRARHFALQEELQHLEGLSSSLVD